MRVALVHDYLTQYGGAERVLDALHEEYPVAPIFTSVLDLESLPEHYHSAQINVSAMAKLPRVNRLPQDAEQIKNDRMSCPIDRRHSLRRALVCGEARVQDNIHDFRRHSDFEFRAHAP